ncbi:glycosyltransferase [Tenacibaculum sp. S7007]|uniref:Glycosyltransferase n=1 Tax=Tenacibaculum pelagium TaxID=2759527 RepID=A0A839ARL4_9FLAO|nr:glycosyltransferase [Tenacibaculum pelagium]MBA6156291.1 glycosyltransferase [Tenacibaculum pelagium]
MFKGVFIGQFIPEKKANQDVRISQAGNNYQFKLIKMLSPQKAFSLVPIFFDSPINMEEESICYIRNLPKKVKFPPYKKLYRLIKDTFHLNQLIKKEEVENTFYYNIDRQNVFSIIMTKYILKKKVYLILADNPNHELKTFSDRFFYFIMKKVNGALVLNANVSINKNQQLLQGLVEENQLQLKKGNLKKNIIFSGSLGKTTGFEVALEAISKRKDCTLYITGKPYKYSDYEFEKIIQSYSKYNNIKYLGLLDFDKYQEILERCDIAFSLRNPLDDEHEYNFPSKILEYLSKSKFVISTLEYKGFENRYLFNCEFNSESVNKILDNIYSLETDEVDRLRILIYNYLKDNFTKISLLNKIEKLIN